MQSEKRLERKKAEAIIKYLLNEVETVEEGDITVEEVVELLEEYSDLDAEARAEIILVYLGEDNSRLDYDIDDIYEISRIIRKRFIRDDDDE